MTKFKIDDCGLSHNLSVFKAGLSAAAVLLQGLATEFLDNENVHYISL
jgi:hypothetical protein